MCVLTRQSAIPVLNSVVVAPATKTVREIPTELILEPQDGMPVRCALSFDNLYTVPKSLLTQRIIRLPARRVPELCIALRNATGC